MDVTAIITIVSALGGIELVKYLLNLRSNFVKAKAEATHAENNVLDDYVEGWKSLYDKQAVELARKDTRIDTLFKQLDLFRGMNEDLRKENTILQIDNIKKDYARCDVDNCTKRTPPRNKETNKIV